MEKPSCRVHKLVADAALLVGREVFLVKYKDVRRYDGQRGWFLPDDYLHHLEHPGDAARRILLHQVGLTAPDVRLGYIESFNGERTAWHLVFHHVVRRDRRPAIVPGENVAAAAWFDVEGLPAAADMAHHGWAADVLRELLRASP